MAMNLYMGFDRQIGNQEGAILIFATSAREARKIGWPFIADWFDTEWVDMAVHKIKTNIEHLKLNANKEKLLNNISHVIDSPKTCSTCDLWGGGEQVNGRCEYCDEWND